ncbi:SusD/RagB-like outer membrane lipoprotein [Ulvibacter sp. MAR_2010_11]|uniref:SusD/RagB family nutrient-binding outer membrane lipoprotein n=1 Tax=Ulvibacter sp. MAR_2010_11 TaxID=1250229 RepID=UPI000CC1683B|nr:SusD/RagB family nutrient-binding outer membrane lipoprotein [Ulvibacter sp. MAR_2010_11]PKA83464.1 SusD/RagB-like outer membrane lipoprotein [Ulvibacter sp. MAR_2010_11]
MKKLNKISILFFLLLGITFTSCETTDLDLLDDPNQITLDKADLERYMVAIQLDFKDFARLMGSNGSQLVRIDYMFGRTYANNFAPENTNTEWAIAYQGMFSDMKNAEAIATEIEANKHIGVMKIIKAYTLLTLVDFYGDIPLSEATQPAEFPNPQADDDAAVYAAALAMLDEGISFLNQDGLGMDIDFYYNNDFSKWIRFANSVKLNAYTNTRKVDGEAMNKFNAIINSGNYISSTADDLQFRYGTNYLTTPDTRHPAYRADYNVSGAGNYRSNWLMDVMYENDDPRRRYYFYRQHICTPNSTGADGVPCASDQQRLFCSTQARPPHYPSSMVFCSVDGGYWGRDHGNAEGIPPDSFRRTAVGVYPAAGNFDDNRFSTVGLEQGGQGAGIVPIMLASWIDLMRAEMAMANNNSSGANTLMQSAMQKSIAKVQSFGSLDPDADLSMAPSAGDVSAYIAGVGAAFTAASTEGKWNILATQNFIAHYGNGIESYNFYRRTGYPTSLQFNIEQSPGSFVRSFFYPADEANTNSSIQQKPNVQVQVFWDNNPAFPAFPVAN